MQGNRKLFCPAPRLEDAVGYEPANVKGRKFMLYGGILYEHFGDMLVDTCRAYQLLLLFATARNQFSFITEHHDQPAVSAPPPLKSG